MPFPDSSSTFIAFWLIAPVSGDVASFASDDFSGSAERSYRVAVYIRVTNPSSLGYDPQAIPVRELASASCLRSLA